MFLQRRICFDSFFFNFIELKGIQFEDSAICKCFSIQIKVNYMMFSLRFSSINIQIFKFLIVFIQTGRYLYIPGNTFLFCLLVTWADTYVEYFSICTWHIECKVVSAIVLVLLFKPEEYQRKHAVVPKNLQFSNSLLCSSVIGFYIELWMTKVIRYSGECLSELSEDSGFCFAFAKNKLRGICCWSPQALWKSLLGLMRNN